MADEKGIELKVQGDKPSGIEDTKLDVTERDPNNINAHLKVSFDEVFGEPNESVYSFDKVWLLSYTVFFTVKLWCYRITSLICALPLMVCWGIYFACISFCTIWVCVPCFTAYEMKLHCVRRFWSTLLNTFYGPCCETAGLFLSKIKVERV